MSKYGSDEGTEDNELNILINEDVAIQHDVTPERETNGGAATVEMDLTKSIEHSPPEGRRLFMDDGKRRFDFILAWSSKEKELDQIKNNTIRATYERNLVKEGIQLEYDIKEGREVQFVKLHATWEVLTRYAEIMHLKMPMKEVPEELANIGILELLTDFVGKFLKPFDLDKTKVPPMPKKFTCVYQRDKEYLFAIPEQKDLFFSHAQRSSIVDYVLRWKRYSDNMEEEFEFGIKRLLSENVYAAAYPCHEGSWKPWAKSSMRRLLYEYWADWRCFYKNQPLDYIKTYFGETIGLYFAWLGFYSWMLVPASVVGLIVFIYGVATINQNTIGQETCDENSTIWMCPRCDKRCPYWEYSSSCTHVRASHMFDNGATVFFAVFMSLWGTIFLEFWKREQASIQFKWNLSAFELEEEPPRPEFLSGLSNSAYKKKNRVTGNVEPFMPFWRRKVPVYVASFCVMLSMVFLALIVIVGVIVYRMSVRAALYLRDEEFIYQNASMVTTATAACINLVIIFILNWIYEIIALKLTDWEHHRTQTEYDNSLTVKLYSLQFVNYYSSIFYIAFFKGLFLGRPGKYNTLFGARQEECGAGGCLVELCIQLAIIFLGKQLLQNNIQEILVPRLKRWMKAYFWKKDKSAESAKLSSPWEKDYLLQPLGHRGLFNEYLELLLQFGFVTIFVAAFPLAPLFALLNNVIEIRADANKFVTQLQRPLSQKAQDIGIWYSILFSISRIAVLTNALIIALTSGFIHRYVYIKEYSPDGSLTGYVNNSLSYFDINDFPEGTEFDDTKREFTHINMTYCRYQEFREPPWSDNKYKYTAEHWHIVAAKVIFIVVFENFVFLTTSIIAYLIPDMPRKLREQVRREAYLTNEIIMRTELEIARGEGGKHSGLSHLELERIRERVRGMYGQNIDITDGIGNATKLTRRGEHGSRTSQLSNYETNV